MWLGLSKEHSTILSSWLLQDCGKYAKRNEFHERGSTAAFPLLWNDFFDWLKAVCNTMVVSKTLCKFMDRSCGRRIVCKQGKSTWGALNPRISVVHHILMARNLFSSRCPSLHLKGTVPKIWVAGGREEVWHASGSPCFLSQKTPRRRYSPSPRNKRQGWG